MTARRSRRSSSGHRLRHSVLAVVWVAGLVLAVLLVGRELLTSARFAVAEVRIDGLRRALHSEVEARAAIEKGTNVFRLDVAAVADRVRAHPWIESVAVRRSLPRAIEVSVIEHEPVALVASEQLYLVDADGDIIKAYAPGDPWALPILTGVARTELEADSTILAPALQLLRDWGERDLPDVSEIGSRGASGYAVRTVDGRRARLGRPPFEDKLGRLQRIWSSPQGRTAVSVRLDAERRAGRATVVLSAGPEEGGR